MVGVTLLHEARRAGLRVRADGGRLVVRGPRSQEALAKRLLEHKAEVLAALEADALGACYACGHRDWWRRPGGPWVCAVCHPPAVTPVERVTRPTPRAQRPACPPEAARRLPPPDPARRVPRCGSCGAELAHWFVTLCQRCKGLTAHP